MNTVPITKLHEVFDYVATSGVLTRKASKEARNLGVVGYEMAKGHLRVKVGSIPLLVHRIAWAMSYGAWPQGQIDHINGIKSDNRITNLRDVPAYINAQNVRRARHDKRDAFMGTTWIQRDRLWHSQIQVLGKKISLGYFKTGEEGHQAYITAKRQLHEGCTI